MGGDPKPQEHHDIDVPHLEPDYSVPAWPTGPGLVPPTQPANDAPFLRPEEEEPAPPQGPFSPSKRHHGPVEPTNYVDIPAAMPPKDRWGIPVTERPVGPIFGSGGLNRSMVSATFQGLIAGLLVGLMAAAIYVSTAVVLGYELAFATLLIGPAVGWAVPAISGRWSLGIAFVAGFAALLSGAVAMVLIMSWSQSGLTGLTLVVDAWEQLSEPRVLLDQMNERMHAVVYVVIAAMFAFFQAAGVGRSRHRR